MKLPNPIKITSGTVLGEGTKYHRVLYPLTKTAQFEYGMETLPSGKEIPRHSHQSQDEIIFVHEGILNCKVDTESMILNKGDSVHLKTGVEHEFKNESSADCTITWTLIRTNSPLTSSNGISGKDEVESLIDQMKGK